MDWINYHRLDVIYAFLESLAADFPYLCTVSVIGKSAEGRDLKVNKFHLFCENGNFSFKKLYVSLFVISTFVN